jgi:hypothetical protein
MFPSSASKAAKSDISDLGGMLFLTLLYIAADLSAARNVPVNLPLNMTPTLKAMAG